MPANCTIEFAKQGAFSTRGEVTREGFSPPSYPASVMCEKFVGATIAMPIVSGIIADKQSPNGRDFYRFFFSCPREFVGSLSKGTTFPLLELLVTIVQRVYGATTHSGYIVRIHARATDTCVSRFVSSIYSFCCFCICHTPPQESPACFPACNYIFMCSIGLLSEFVRYLIIIRSCPPIILFCKHADEPIHCL